MSTDHDIGYGWSHKQEEGEKEVVRLLCSRQSGLDNNRYDTGSTEEKEESHHS